MPRDYYEVLGLSRDCSKEEIRKAYKRLAMKYHPDRHDGEAAMAERFREAKEAYDVLSDSSKREMYDRYGHEGARAAANGAQAGGAAGFNFGDIFGDVFGDIFESGARGSRRGRDVQVGLEIDFKEAVFGVSKDIKLSLRRSCEPCQGTGAEPGSKRSTCKRCNGQGKVRIQQGFFTIQQSCNRCQGSGQVLDKPCKHCDGAGVRKQSRTLSVKIPAGIEDGSRIRLSHEGESAGLNSTPGHLYVDIHVRPHDTFSRNADDLYCDIEVPFTKAALGGSHEIDSLTGKARLTIAPGTQSGQVLRLKNKGVPNVNTQKAGSLYCRVKITVPKKLSKEQTELIKKLQSSLERKSRFFG